MLYRRFTTSLRRLDWTVILVDLTVVVMGILIAIAVDGWNQTRIDRQNASQWRDAVINDLSATKRQAQYRIRYYEQALAFGETALNGLQRNQDTQDPAHWDTVLGAFHASQIWPFEIAGPAYREVQLSGKLNYLGDARILNMLSRFYDITASDFQVVSGGTLPYRSRVRELIPWVIQDHIWSQGCQSQQIDDVDGGNIFTLVNCTPFEDNRLLEQSVQVLRDDLQLRERLTGRLSQLKIMIVSLRNQTTHIDQVVDALTSYDETE